MFFMLYTEKGVRTQGRKAESSNFFRRVQQMLMPWNIFDRYSCILYDTPFKVGWKNME